MIVSADTLVYFGALEAVTAAAANGIASGGVLVFTVEELSETASDAGYGLSPNGRYHTRRLPRAHAHGCGTAVGDPSGRAAARGGRAGCRICRASHGDTGSPLSAPTSRSSFLRLFQRDPDSLRIGLHTRPTTPFKGYYLVEAGNGIFTSFGLFQTAE